MKKIAFIITCVGIIFFMSITDYNGTKYKRKVDSTNIIIDSLYNSIDTIDTNIIEK